MISRRAKNAGIKELEIFDNFRIDDRLPKYHVEVETNENEKVDFDVSMSVPVSGGVWSNSEGNWIDGSTEKDINIISRFRAFFTLKSIVRKKQKQERKKNLITIRDFFINFSSNFKELTPLADIADHYEKAIKQASQLGQESLVEKLKDMLSVVRGEAHLIQMGLKYYVTQEQVYDFYESVSEDKNLKLTWIRNFVKIIPEDVIKIKAEVDKRKIFDNYVIMHYDPQNNATDLTKEEKEIKKDPILFGVIKNSNKLYYVADWKDDYCDLTLEGMFETLKERVLEINNRNLKTYIDKVGNYEQKRKK